MALMATDYVGYTSISSLERSQFNEGVSITIANCYSDFLIRLFHPAIFPDGYFGEYDGIWQHTNGF
jgi:hypothetical protein